ncbi:MAG: hypothetical protein ACOYN0_10465, partial [Phycisphaerales bacterium]
KALMPRGAAVFSTEGLFGDNYFIAAKDMPRSWIPAQMPVLARKSVLNPPWGETAAEVLAREGITVRDLGVPGLRRPFFGEAMRPVVMHATGFTLGAPEPDDMSDRGRLKRNVAFSLSKGGYATIVMRSLGQ